MPGPVVEKPILVVEDDPDDAELLVRALRKVRVVNPVDLRTDGELALQYLAQRRSAASRDGFPIFMMLDLKLSKVGGYDVLHRMEADGLLKELPVVVVTSSKRQEDLVEGYRLGIRSFLRKPVDASKLAVAVGKLGVSWLLVERKPARS